MQLPELNLPGRNRLLFPHICVSAVTEMAKTEETMKVLGGLVNRSIPAEKVLARLLNSVEFQLQWYGLVHEIVT